MKNYLWECFITIVFVMLFLISVGTVVHGAASAIEHGKCTYDTRIQKYNPIYRATCWLFEDLEK